MKSLAIVLLAVWWAAAPALPSQQPAQGSSSGSSGTASQGGNTSPEDNPKRPHTKRKHKQPKMSGKMEQAGTSATDTPK